MGGTIRKLGLFEIDKKIKIKKLVKSTTGKVIRSAKKNLENVDTGDTRNSIKSKYLFDGMGSTVKPRLPKGYKAHWIEYGTGERVQSKGKRRTGRMLKNPFMKPAEEKHREAFFKGVEKVVRKDTSI